MVEGVGSIIGKGVNGGGVFLIPESSRHQLEVVLQPEVLGLLVDHFLKASDASHRHLDADHHVQHQIPVIIAEEDHLPFPLHVQPLVHVLGRLVLALAHLLPPVLKFLGKSSEDVFGRLNNTVYFVLNEL